LSMKEYIDDLKDANSESLAAIHFKNKYIPSNQCYQCHTQYGINGTFEAKKAGTIDVYKYFTRTFHKPLKMRSPYPNDDCLKCHNEAPKFQMQELHVISKDTILSGETKCMDCHKETHPAHVLPTLAAK